MGAAAIPLIAAGASVGSSIIGANAAKGAASDAANAQQQLTQQDLQYLKQAGADARGAISGMLPYTKGASQAASMARQAPPWLAPGMGATFGGQQVNATPTGGSADYSSLLSPQTMNQFAPNGWQTPGGMRAFAPTSGSFGAISPPSGGAPGTQRMLQSTGSSRAASPPVSGGWLGTLGSALTKATQPNNAPPNQNGDIIARALTSVPFPI